MVHVTDVKKITLTEQVADEYEKLSKEGRFSKKCIPRGYIPDFDWTTIHLSQDPPIKPIQQQDPTEDTTTPAAPTEVEGPPSSHLRSKTKQQHTSHKQDQPECNPTPMDPPEHNPAEIEVNSVDITPISYSWMRLTKLISYSGKTINDSDSHETCGLNQIMIISVKNTKFFRQEFIRPYSHETHGLDQNCMNFMYFQVSGTHSPPPPFLTKILQLVKFRPTSALAHN